jgi:regulator of protease activity HflC (stomatin/prohibitin superfamily)
MPDLTLVIPVLIVVIYLLSSIKILAEYERGVIFRLGRVLPQPKGPGVILVSPPSIASCAFLSESRRWRCHRRTLLRATT